MLHEQLSETWSSPNEFVVTDRQRSYIAELAATDARIGSEAAAKYGRGTIPKRSIPVRLVRRALFELKKIVGPAARKAQRFTLRQWNRRVADRRRVPDGASFELSGRTFAVINLNSETAKHSFAQTSAEFLILTREPNALLHSAKQPMTAAVESSSAGMWFGDSRNVHGIRERRPVFNRLLLRQVDALGPVVIVRSDLLLTAASPDVPTALWPLALGLTMSEDSVELIPEVLGVGPATVSELGEHESAAAALVKAELVTSSIRASVTPAPLGRRTIEYQLANTPLVSIIIPTRGTGPGGNAYVAEAVKSIIAKSSYPQIEIVIVADDPTPQAVVSQIDELADASVKWVRWSQPFNFSGKMNLGAACASGEYLLFLNDDVEVVSSDWIERMLSLIGVDGIQYSGALLFFEDQTIQHAGHVYKGGPGHIGFGDVIRRNDANQLLALDRVVTGVTAACSLMSQSMFTSIGGFSQAFPGNYNDVDLSLKVSESGARVAVAGGARLYHFESKTRDATVQRSEIEQLHLRWVRRISADDNYRGLEA